MRNPLAGAALLLAGVLPGCGGCSSSAAPEATPSRATAGAPSDAARTAPVTEDSLRALFLELPPHRAIGTTEHVATRDWIVARLRALGLSPRLQPFEWAGLPGGDLANVELVVPGESADAPLVLLSAHYDSVRATPGADDNGSGTVALLELARRLAGGAFPRELRLLWFDAEEPGLLGSGYWVQALPAEDSRRLVGLVNLETLGYTDRRPGSQRLPQGVELVFDPGDRGDFLLCLGNLASAALAKVVNDALAAETSPVFRVETFSYLPGNGLVLPDSRRSDHAQFWDRGLPAVLLTDTAFLRSPHYHAPSDTLETLDLSFLAAAVRGVERAARTLLGAGN
jgi:hypothetical protein